MSNGSESKNTKRRWRHGSPTRQSRTHRASCKAILGAAALGC
jgi:hypothetical protein